MKPQRGSGDWDTVGKELIFTSSPTSDDSIADFQNSLFTWASNLLCSGYLEDQESRMTPFTIWGSLHHLPFGSNKVKSSLEMKLSKWAAVQCPHDCFPRASVSLQPMESTVQLERASIPTAPIVYLLG